jgi:histidine triad (HIT) family protein
VNDPPVVDRGDDRRKHLDFIQSAIARMSTTATLAKGWCLTVSVAALGFAINKNSVGVGLLGALAVVLFGILDARYLREERKFRALYDDARLDKVDVYDMGTFRYIQPGGSSFTSACQWREVLRSWSLWAFYGPLLAACAAAIVAACGN